MKHASIMATGAFIATLGLGTVALAQETPVQQVRQNTTATATNDVTFSTLTSALATVPQSAQRLNRMTAIAQTVIGLIPVSSESLTPMQRLHLARSIRSGAQAQLQDAMSRATVATLDRPNGVSEDQVTVAAYVEEQGIDPKSVIGVTFRTPPDDRANPNVTIYYRQGGLETQ